MLAAIAITRRFGRTRALDGVDFQAYPGEIHALVGENGAGKSSLINIFAGRLKPDNGTVTLDGAAIAGGSAHAALKAGIAAVYQSPMLFERMSWEENLALGGFGAGTWRNDSTSAASRARAVARQLGFTLPSAGAAVEHCSVGERVRLEILRALSFDPRVLILDEPTGVLAPAELGAFLETLQRLRTAGRIVLIVTHKLSEAITIADRITVLRQGRVAAVRLSTETDAAELARLMIGEVVPSSVAAGSTSSIVDCSGVGQNAAPDTPALVVDHLILAEHEHRLLDDISFTLSAGEIAGVAGVEGNGQRQLVEVMAGIRTPTSGALQVVTAGAVAVIPQNRDLDGLVLDMPLWENMLLARPLRYRFARRGWLRRVQAMAFCIRVLDRYRIQSAGAASFALTLSGGNRQRLAVARALACEPSVLVVHDVCRGLDLRATAELHRRLREFAAAGGAVLLISSDLDEVLALSTSLYVMARGRLTAVTARDRDAERIGLLMSGTAQL